MPSCGLRSRSSYRKRFLGLLEAGKRSRVRRDLPHFKHLDARFAQRIPDGEQTKSAILDKLRKKGSPPNRYVFSEDSDIDGQELPTAEALDRVVGFGYGSLISCVPRRLAYFEGEQQNPRYILERDRP